MVIVPPGASPVSADRASHSTIDAHLGIASTIRGFHRQRQDFHRAEKSLTLQIKAIERRLSSPDLAFFATEPLVLARAAIKPHRLAQERKLQKLAKQLPVWPFVDAINGFGALGLAQIIGEAGDLSNYSNPAKLWKRMGLAVFDGKSQRRVAGAAAIEQGYSPVRRAIMFCIGDSLLKKQNAYRELYLARKVLEEAKLPEGTKMHWHRRAQRYVEKRLLRDLWRAWREKACLL